MILIVGHWGFRKNHSNPKYNHSPTNKHTFPKEKIFYFNIEYQYYQDENGNILLVMLKIQLPARNTDIPESQIIYNLKLFKRAFIYLK